MSHDGVGLRAVMRSVAFLTAGALAVPVLTACSADDEEKASPVAAQDIAPAGRNQVTDGGTLRWAVDAVPATLNTFQADADATTSRVAGAVLPSLYRLDRDGRPQLNPDYLESAKVVDEEPKQVVLYKLNQQAVWSDGREIGADDFAAQWRALSGKDSAYWTARNAGYDRIEKIERGKNNLEVRVTFSRPYADWKSLFSPLYPKDVMGAAATFNDGARRKLKVTASTPSPCRASTARPVRSTSPAIPAGGAAPPSSRRSRWSPSRATSGPPHSPRTRSTWPTSIPRRPAGSRSRPEPGAAPRCRARVPRAARSIPPRRRTPPPRSTPPSRTA